MSTTHHTVEDGALDAIARHFHQVVRKYTGERHLEVEMRLCHFDLSLPPASKETFRVLRPGQSKNKVKVGVTAAHFEQIKAALTAAPEPAGAEERAPKKVRLEESTTEDVTVGSSRSTYLVVPDSGTEKRVPQAVMHKKRLEVVDVRLFNRPYDVRLSVSSEMPSTAAALPPADPPKGYTRRKVRTSVSFPAEHIRYDLTVVNAGRDKTYEVELEGVFEDVQSQLTERWIAEALKRLLQWSSPAN